MADYDVGIAALTSPPSLAVITSYRPAVSVRNNGIHDALASGTLRIYSAGLLIFTTELYSSTIAPGAIALAQAVDYWTPPALGKYQVIAYVTCPLDQVEANNSLAPVFITVIEGQPPTPPVIPLHAAQHEEGGTDEIIADGLHGRLTDPQTPLEHNTSHQVAGHDELDLTGMHGVLADGQPIADHAATHEPLGGDVLNVDGLHGELYNVQKPKTHGNEAHDPNYAKTPHGNEAHTPDFENAGVAAAKIASHDADNNSHDSSTKLEHKSDKGAANGYASLGAGTLVPHAQLGSGPMPGETPRFLRDDQAWVEQTTPAHKTTHQALGTDEISVAGLSGTLATQQSPIGHHLRHEAGGDDVITALGPHHSSHELNGSDKISVAGLSGRLADAQPTDFTEGHNTQQSVPTIGPETTIITLSIPAAQFSDKFSARLKSHFQILLTAGTNPYLKIRLRKDSSEAVLLEYHFSPLNNCYFDIEADIYPWSPGHYAASIRIIGVDTTNTAIVKAAFSGGGYTMPTTPTDFKITVEPFGVDPNTSLYSEYAWGYTTSHTP